MNRRLSASVRCIACWYSPVCVSAWPGVLLCYCAALYRARTLPLVFRPLGESAANTVEQRLGCLTVHSFATHPCYYDNHPPINVFPNSSECRLLCSAGTRVFIFGRVPGFGVRVRCHNAPRCASARPSTWWAWAITVAVLSILW